MASNLTTNTGGTPIPSNFFKKSKGNVFKNAIEENHSLEQFFWTTETVEKLAKACNYVYTEETCCLTTPSLAQYWHEQGRDETLLDIDQRFSYLPSFKYFDLRQPDLDGLEDKTFRLLIIDPPFFLIPIETVAACVDEITGRDYTTKILIAFILRGEQRLRKAFEKYDLKPTKFPLQYSSIKETKWNNFVLYSNIDLPGIKRKIE